MRPSVSHDLYPRWLFFSFEAATALLGGGCAFLAVSFLSLSTPYVLVPFHWDTENSLLTLSASIAAMLTGLGLWKYCTARVQWMRFRRAIGAGMLFSVLAHPLTWYLTMILSFFAHLLDPSGPFGVLGVDPFSAVLGSMFLSLSSLVLVGWLTLLVSAIMSAGLVLLLRRQKPVLQYAQS
ncbi:MAG TPA: hypothetical protein VHZ51_13045 [Ktedonobacteraceae bacterium]|jgi:hypothetical protein|nr:hypothetical protein [Ktedonobacteraceae bacterium]